MNFSLVLEYQYNYICIRNISLTNFLCSITGVKKAGHTLKTNMFFDTIKFTPRNGQNEIIHRANKHKINLRYYLDGSVGNLSLLRLHVSVINVYSISVCKQLISIETKCSMHFNCLCRLEFLWMKQLKERT